MKGGSPIVEAALFFMNEIHIDSWFTFCYGGYILQKAGEVLWLLSLFLLSTRSDPYFHLPCFSKEVCLFCYARESRGVRSRTHGFFIILLRT